ncbi:hypothetical protein HDU77_008441 [Chytriomyces hyalinus]|nr:hypothetical protein HDU77_008441 [Chytriomyces hyalinus]
MSNEEACVPAEPQDASPHTAAIKAKSVSRKQSALVFLFQHSESVRFDFIRKFYVILAVQLLFAWLASFVFMDATVKSFAQSNLWLVENSSFWGLVFSFFLHEQRGNEPSNSHLFVAYSIYQSLTIGLSSAAFNYENDLNHFLLLSVYWFIGISFYTYQSYLKFDGVNPYVFGGIVVFLLVWLVEDNGFLGLCFVLFLYGHTLLTTYDTLRTFTPHDAVIAAVDWNMLLVPIVNGFFLLKHWMW